MRAGQSGEVCPLGHKYTTLHLTLSGPGAVLNSREDCL